MKENRFALPRLFEGKGKSLRQGMLHLMLSSGFLSFLAAVILVVASFFVLRAAVTSSAAELREEAVGAATRYADREVTEKIKGISESRAKEIENRLDKIRTDVACLAEIMDIIADESHSPYPQPLIDARESPVRSGEAYLLYDAMLSAENAEDALADKISRDSESVLYMMPLSKIYDSFAVAVYVASADNYFICVENDPGHEALDFPESFVKGFRPKERPWYVAASHESIAGKPVFTDVYIGVDDGLASISCAMAYYRGGTLAGVAGMGFTLDTISDIVEKAGAGKTGFSFVLDNRGQVILSGRREGLLAPSVGGHGIRDIEEKDLSDALSSMMDGGRGIETVHLDGEEYYLAYVPMDLMGWSFGTLISKKEAVSHVSELRENFSGHMTGFDAALNDTLAAMNKKAAGCIVVAFVIVVALSFRLSRRFVAPLYEIGAGVREIAGGNLDERLDIHTGDEIERLANDINDMTSQMKEYMGHLAAVTSERERIKTELALAASIQAGMLPSVRPDFFGKGSYSLAASMQTAKEVGGDFYDFYMLPGNRLAVTIADVSGKGIGASLFMVVSKTVLKETMLSAAARAGGGEPDYAAAMEAANRRLCEGNEEDMFVTVFFGVLDLASGDFAYVNGGHNPPLIGRGGGFEYLRMKKKSAMLGVIEFEKYHEHHAKLSAGDMIFLYTDGVTEAMDERGEEYTEERLRERLIACRDMDVDGLLAAVREDVAAHAGGAAQSDDITMMALKYLGEG